MSSLPKAGYHALHSNPGLNFTLNRLVGSIPPEEIKAVASRITTLESWISEMQEAAAKAEEEGRLLAAGRYLQAAEFYMKQGDPGKAEIYQHSIELINRALPEMASQRGSVPYESGFLPFIRVPAVGQERDVLFIHSGFDGLVEEMYPMFKPMASAGYTVIAFEGPGQGGALRTSNLHMPYDWEKPVSAILDHFNINDCTLIGMSLGGYLAPRAAAFEKRIRRVVSWGAMFDFFEVYRRRVGTPKFQVFKILLNLKLTNIVNALITKASENDDILKWAVTHGMHVSGTDTPFDYLQWTRTLNLTDSAHFIDQDALLIMGVEDHLVSPDQLYVQAASMTRARSVHTVMLSKHDHAAQHCQVGNTELGVKLILNWLESLEQRDEATEF
ncbi:MAG: alpha/beta fold hydrolase [Pseudomonadales bacterium]|nr:alpha/beta fold hydrolase [Pseudomonadales bacterium]